MPTVSGHVYYMAGNVFTPGTGIQNVPVVLFDPTNLVGVVALTDASGAFSFLNVPNGSYNLIEAWGAVGGTPTPVNFTATPMPIAPTEAEPPLTALSVAPPVGADLLQARTPNLLLINVAGGDVTDRVFYDGPVGNRPLNLIGVNMVGPNLITAADNGTWGSYSAGTLGSTMEPTDPYPGVSPGFTYVVDASPNDGQFTVINTNVAVTGPNSPWWGTSDHETRLETGRYILVNGDNPGEAFFTQQVTVTPNTDYILSAWIMNLIVFQSGFENPKLGLQVLDENGNILVAQNVNSIPPQLLPMWFENGFVFNSSANTNLTIQVVSRGLAAQGNDYAVDDISLYQAEFTNQLDTNKSIQPPVVYSETGVGESVTVTVNVSNPTAQTISNVFFQDILDPLLLFTTGSVLVNGSNVGFETADPNVGFSIGNLAAGSGSTVTFMATTTGGPATVPNTANITYDAILSGNGDIIRATFPTNTAEVEIQVNTAVLAITKAVDFAYIGFGEVLTYTLTLQNTGNVAATNVSITDAVPNGTTFVPDSVIGAIGTPPTLTLANPIEAGDSATISFQVRVGDTIPQPNPIPNAATAEYTFTVDPQNPHGGSGNATSNTVTTRVNYAEVNPIKSVNRAYAQPGDILTYTLTLHNAGNVTANNAVLTDAVPAGTTLIPGSVTGAIGTPPTLTIINPIPAGGSVTVTFQVKVVGIPAVNPIANFASLSYKYTANPANPNGKTDTKQSNTVTTQISTATLTTIKSVDKNIAYLGDIIAYQIAVTNTGNVSANNVILTDLLPIGFSLVPGSLVVSVPYSGSLFYGIQLTNPIAPNQTVSLSFAVKVDSIPNPNPANNQAKVNYSYTVDPENPNGTTCTVITNTVKTVVFRNNYGKQINDIIGSVASEQAALAALANAEGAKIQRLAAMQGVTPEQLLCLNKSVVDVMESMAMLETVLKQKLSVLDCQIGGEGC